MDSVKASQFGQLFRPDNFVFGENVDLPVTLFSQLKNAELDMNRQKKITKLQFDYIFQFVTSE